MNKHLLHTPSFYMFTSTYILYLICPISFRYSGSCTKVDFQMILNHIFDILYIFAFSGGTEFK